MAQARRRRAGGGAGETGGNSDRASLYQEVTDRIITELEAGRVPWVQPWDSAQAGIGLPTNAVTGRHYSGINVLILWAAVIGKAYPSQSWLTFRQALGLGGAVRKGERGTTVVYADRFIPEAEKERARRTAMTRPLSRSSSALPCSTSRSATGCRSVPLRARRLSGNARSCPAPRR